MVLCYGSSSQLIQPPGLCGPDARIFCGLRQSSCDNLQCFWKHHGCLLKVYIIPSTVEWNLSPRTCKGAMYLDVQNSLVTQEGRGTITGNPEDWVHREWRRPPQPHKWDVLHLKLHPQILQWLLRISVHRNSSTCRSVELV